MRHRVAGCEAQKNQVLTCIATRGPGFLRHTGGVRSRTARDPPAIHSTRQAGAARQRRSPPEMRTTPRRPRLPGRCCVIVGVQPYRSSLAL
jgi:hypothetical protein